MVVVFVVKLEKVRFVLQRSQEDRMGPWVSNENRMLVTRAATYAPGPGSSPAPHPPESLWRCM